MTKIFEIRSNFSYPSNMLSNFYPHHFVFDGVFCSSMEGLLQSLKFSDVNEQLHVAKLVGKMAHDKGKSKRIKNQTLYWKGKPFNRHSDGYNNLLYNAYYSMAFQCPDFKTALLATNDCVLSHKTGHNDPFTTILTETEFVDILTEMRDFFNAEKSNTN